MLATVHLAVVRSAAAVPGPGATKGGGSPVWLIVLVLILMAVMLGMSIYARMRRGSR